ncbi:MAG: ABC transporter permease, partial [Gemmatimonadetes bacterium]|nr:ABC transporter permease [Gemmatimonadota bacterium]
MGDVRYALRTYRRSPGFTAVAILTLAVGLGAITSIFTFVNAFFLKPLPYHDAESLVMVWETAPPEEGIGGDGTITVNPANYLDWTSEARSFSRMAAFNIDYATLTGEGDPERVVASVVIPGLFGILGVQPALGTVFSQEHGQPGLDKVAILSDGLWQRRYGGDPAIVGESIIVDGEPLTVLGVMPTGYAHPDPSAEWLLPEIWRPIALDPATMNRSGRWMRVMARLAPGVSVEQAQAEMTGIAARLAEAYPETNEGWGTRVVSLRDQQFASARPALLMLLGVGGLVLLIVCVNLANLFLARSHGRSREFAVRSAVGSGRARLARQLLMEGLVVSAVGGVLGILLTLLASGTLRNLQTQHFPSIADVGIDFRVVLFALLASTLTAVLFSLLPVFSLSRPELRSVLSEGGSGSGTGRRALQTREWLVIGEIGLTTVFLFGAVLLTRSFLELTSVPPGFGTQSTLTFNVVLPREQYVDPHRALAFFDELLPRLEALPGAQAVTMA